MGAVGLLALSTSRRRAGVPVLARCRRRACSSGTPGWPGPTVSRCRPWPRSACSCSSGRGAPSIASGLPTTPRPARPGPRRAPRRAGRLRAPRRAAPGLGVGHRRRGQRARRPLRRAGHHRRGRCRGRGCSSGPALPPCWRGPQRCRHRPSPGWRDGAPRPRSSRSRGATPLGTPWRSPAADRPGRRHAAVGVAPGPGPPGRGRGGGARGRSELSAPTRSIAWPPPGWLLVACDVGQGDGLVVNSGPGRAVVVDTGPDPELIDGCLERLRHRGRRPRRPHALPRRPRRRAGRRARRPAGGRDPRLSGAGPAGRGRGGAPARARRPAPASASCGRASVSRSVPSTADVWWPAREIDAGSVANNGSVVLTLHVGGVSFLLAGDIEREAAAAVLREARRDPARWGAVDVLKVAHHGSGNRDDRLLDHVSGRLALISVGDGQRLRPPDAVHRRGARGTRLRGASHRRRG